MNLPGRDDEVQAAKLDLTQAIHSRKVVEVMCMAPSIIYEGC